MFQLQTAIVSRPLNCMQVQYIFLYALNLTQCFTEVCYITVERTESWTDRHRPSFPLLHVSTHFNK